MTIWLLEQTFALDFEQARARLTPTGDQLVAFARVQAQSEGSIARVVGSTCEIPIVGVLTKARDRLAWLYGVGNTTYADIRAAVAAAEADPAIKRIVLRIDSPGGQVDGLFEAIDAISTCTKPTVALCDRAASAAYGLAAAAKRIEATGRASSFGSIGVATAYSYWNGETLVELTNTDSPDKRPDARTESGKAVIVKELDAIASLFVDAIARGRGTTSALVKVNFGRGAMLLAAEAKRLGMIDSMPRASAPSSTSTASPAARAPGQEHAADLGDAIIAIIDGAPQLHSHGTEEPAAGGLDLGDQIVALADGEQAAHSSSAEPAADGLDLGDQIVALVKRTLPLSSTPSTARSNAPASKEPASTTRHDSTVGSPPANADLGDQIAEQMLAQTERREPATWATRPLAEVAGQQQQTPAPAPRDPGPDPEGETADRLIAVMNRFEPQAREAARR